MVQQLILRGRQKVGSEMLAFVYIRRRKTSLSYHAEEGIVVSPFTIDKALFKSACRSRRAEKRPPACKGINSTDAKSHETNLFHALSSHIYATSWTTPPASLILRSASLLTYRARTIKGISGIRPLPRTLL
jgi:hypothetical protein